MRRDYSTPCPLSLDERHAWTIDPWGSSRAVHRFACPCGAYGWRESAEQDVRQYAPDSDHAKRARERSANAVLRPETITARESVGRNATGHKLPANAPMRRRGFLR